MSSKYCDHYGYCHHHCRRKLYLRILVGVLAFIALILFIVLLVFLILRPSKPEFYLRNFSVVQFNLTGGSNAATTDIATASCLLSSTFQVTVNSRNPNNRVGIYYDRLDAYAEYNHQQVTVPTSLPTGYQGHKDSSVWSPFLYGDAIPLGPYTSEAIGQDENAGLLLINVKLDGRLKWKVGTWISGHYHIYVNCPAFLTVTNGKGSGGAPGFKYENTASCTVEV